MAIRSNRTAASRKRSAWKVAAIRRETPTRGRSSTIEGIGARCHRPAHSLNGVESKADASAKQDLLLHRKRVVVAGPHIAQEALKPINAVEAGAAAGIQRTFHGLLCLLHGV